MRRRYIVLGALVLVAALYAGAFSMLNGNSVAATRDLEIASTEPERVAGETLNLMIWNLGYAGLGRESDFVADGGTSYFPPSRAAVRARVRP